MNQTNENNQINNNLPAVISNKKSISKLEKEHPRLINSLKRAGKITGYSLGGLGFLTIAASGAVFTLPAVSGVGIACALGMFTKAGINTVFQNEEDLLFTARRGMIDREIKLFQRMDVVNKVKGLKNFQLAGLMTLNTLVGFERYKSLINTSKFTEENGRKVYNQKFSTKTHGVNIKILKLLGELGYIKIDDISDKKGKSGLLIEKIALGNTKGVNDYFKALISGDKEQIEKQKVDMHIVKFRLTDKKIDLVEMYRNYIECKKDKKTIDLISIKLFDKRRGILAPNLNCSENYYGKKGLLNKIRNTHQGKEENAKLEKKTLRLRKTRKMDKSRKVGIEYDNLGRPYINYDAKQSGVETFDIIIRPSLQEKKQNFRQSIEASNIVQIDKEKIQAIDKSKNILNKDEEREIL